MLYLVDLDGVVYRGITPIPGVAGVLADRVAKGDRVIYVTNNSMHHRTDYVARLAGMGAPVDDESVVNSSRATALYLARERDAGARIHRILTLGAPGLDRELRDAGFDVIGAPEVAETMLRDGIDGFEAAGRPDAVVVGLDPNVTYMRLAAAVTCIRAGARFVATNRDPVFPTEKGLRPGAGSCVAAVEAASQRTPVSIGKPAPLLLEMAARAAGMPVSSAVMIGDGLTSDLAAANAVGIPCVFMLTGVSTRAEVEALPADQQPVAFAADAAELAVALERNFVGRLMPPLETDLYPPVRDFLVAQGFTVRGEVHGCDVVGVQGEDVVVVELKRGLTVDLLAQVVLRQKMTESVYAAIPRPLGSAGERRLRELLPLLRRLECGLLVVDAETGVVEVRLQPVPAQRRREPRKRKALLAEVAARSADETPGGTHRRRLMTAYRERAIFLAVALERFGPSTPAALRAAGAGAETLAILRGNAYRWFERVERGVYRLTATGSAGLAEFHVVAERKRAKLAEADGVQEVTE